MATLSADLLALATPDELLALAELDDAEAVLEGLRGSLLAFAEHVQPDFLRFRHSVYLAGYLERLADPADGLNRLLVSMPPRSGKTMLASTIFPTWYLTRYPERTVMLTSATAGLAVGDLSPKIREYLRSNPELPDISPDRRAKSYFKLAESAGGVVASGVGGQITGKPAHLLICDDPVKSADDAASPTKSNACWEWWQSTARTRCEPGAAMLVVMTRWASDDLAGRILESEAADEWHVINLPALAGADDDLGRDEGEALVPERYDVADLELVRAEVGPKVWASLYMGQPVPDTGEFFSTAPGAFDLTGDGRYVVRTEIVEPEACTHFLVVDGAASPKSSSDPTGVVSVAVTPSGDLLLRDAWALRMRGPDLERWITDRFERDPYYQFVFIENSVISRHLVDSLRAARVVPVRAEAPTDSKEIRAIDLQRMLDTGRVFFPPVEHDGVIEARRQLMTFPLGQHDDLVDALAWAARQRGSNRKTRLRAAGLIPDSIGTYQ